MSKTAYTLQEFLNAPSEFSTISLGGKNITDDDCAKLAAVLKNNNTVTQLILNQNQIGDAGAAAIAEGVKVNKTITYLQLHQNQIGDAGAAAIAEGIKVNKTITYLYLHQNQIGDAGAAAIAEGVKANKTINTLYLQQNHISSQGLELLKSNWQGGASYLNVSSQNAAAVQPVQGANNAQQQINKFDHDCFFTAFNNDLASVQKRLACKDLDLNKPDTYGKTLLWHAAFFSREQMVKLLLEGGAQLGRFNSTDKTGHVALEAPILLKNTNIINMIKVAMVADHVYLQDDLNLQELDLSLGNDQGKANRAQFLERLKVNLLKNGIPQQYLSEHYKLKLQEYLKDHLPDSFAKDIAILLEYLHLGRAKVIDEVQGVLGEILQSGGDSAIDLVKLFAASEETVALMVNSERLDQAVHKLASIILTKEEKQVVDALLLRYDSLEAEVKTLIKQNHPTIEDAADTLLAAVNIQELKLPGNVQHKAKAGQAKPVKKVAKKVVNQAIDDEEVEAYDPKIDLELTKIFTNADAAVAVEAVELLNHQDIINVTKLIREGNDRLQELTSKGILLLGNTGAGKTTLAHLLSGRKLQAIYDDGLDELIVDAMQPHANIVIGHKMASETKIPNKCSANGITIWDCPGFNDTEEVQEIANSFYIKKLFETTGQMKFVLVVPKSDLTNQKGANFLATLSSFMKTFSNMEAIKDSISLVITKVPTSKKLQHIKNSIEKILTDNQSVTEDQKILVHKLVNSSLHLFHEPRDEGVFNYTNLLEAIEGSTNYMQGDPELANLSISEKAVEYSAHLLNIAGNNFNKISEVTVKAVADATSCLTVNPNNIFSQNYGEIKPLIPTSIHYKNLAQHQANEYFSELDLLFKMQKIFSANGVVSISDGLNILEQAVESIAEYAQAGDTELKHQIQDYSYCLKQQYEYVKFFAGVCGKELPSAQNLTELLARCHAKVAENLEFQVSSIQLNHNIIDPDYYHKALEYLEQYPNSKPCIKLKALCYNGLANIDEQQADTDRAIGYYVKSIETDKHQAETYEKLGQLFFSKGKYAKAIEAYKVVNNEFKIKACFKAWLGQDAENPDIMLKQAEYFESIGVFDKAKIYYHHAFSLSKDETIKANAFEKISNIMSNAATIARSFAQKAQDHDFFNFDSVDEAFIYNLLGDGNPFADFHA